jgi:hypothetical protein
MKRGELSAYRPLVDSVLDAKALLWLAWDGEKIHAAAVTELHVTEWRKVCVIAACGGERLAWSIFIEPLEQFARAEKCAAMRIVGREGWQRVLKDYRRKRVILEKELL